MKSAKLIVIVGSGMLMAGLAIGDNASAIKDAMATYACGTGDVVKAQAMFEAIPNSAQALEYAGHCLRVQQKPAEALVALESARALRTNVNNIVYLNTVIAECLWQTDKKAEAETLLKKTIADYPAASQALRCSALNFLGTILTRQGKYTEANDVLVKYIILAVRTKSVDATITKAFNAVRPDLMTTDAYQTALQDILKATPAIETNTTFLGQVKSELEKIK